MSRGSERHGVRRLFHHVSEVGWAYLAQGPSSAASKMTLDGATDSILFPNQRAIAEMLRAVDSKIAAEERRKAALDALFKTLLHHLMTGRVRVCTAVTEPVE